MLDVTNQRPKIIKNNHNEPNNEQKRSEEMTEKVQELLPKIREVCAEKSLSVSDIMKMLENTPDAEPLSRSTVEAILKDSPRSAGIKYSTIRPLVRILLDVAEDTQNAAVTPDQYDPERGREYFAEREALRQVVLIKTAEEERLRAHIDKIEATNEKKLAEQSILHDSNIDRLLSLHNEHKVGQERTISLLEKENEFLRSELTAERESRKRLYDDLKKYMDKYGELSEMVRKLQKFHEDDD